MGSHTLTFLFPFHAFSSTRTTDNFTVVSLLTKAAPSMGLTILADPTLAVAKRTEPACPLVNDTIFVYPTI